MKASLQLLKLETVNGFSKPTNLFNQLGDLNDLFDSRGLSLTDKIKYSFISRRVKNFVRLVHPGSYLPNGNQSSRFQTYSVHRRQYARSKFSRIWTVFAGPGSVVVLFVGFFFLIQWNNVTIFHRRGKVMSSHELLIKLAYWLLNSARLAIKQ